MVTSDNRLRGGLLSLLLGGVLIFAGCASTGPKEIKEPVQSAQDAQGEAALKKKPEEKKISVEYVNVVGDGDRVLIGTTGPIKYTVFKLSDPARLIVDMPGVNLEKVTSPLAVDNDFLREITAVNYGDEKDICRIVIGMKEGIDHEVKSGENSILVSLKKSPSLASSSEPSVAPAVPVKASNEPVREEQAIKEEPIKEEVAKPAEPVRQETAAAPKAQDAPVKAVKAEEKPAGKATRILGINAAKEGENTVIRIKTDGAPGNYNAFDLDSPARIVIDVWGVDNSIGKDLLKMNGRYIKAVRIGNYEDKSRLVFDGANQKLPPHNIKRVNDSIVITMGPKVKPDENTSAANDPVRPQVVKAAFEPAAEPKEPKQEPVRLAQQEEARPPEPAPKPEPEDNAAAIQSVDFKKVDDIGRLTISSSSRPEYTVTESKDGKTLVLDMKNTVIPDELMRTLDATKLKTSVATISSYQESMKPRKNVRFLVKLKDKTSYEVKEDNGALRIDFAPAASAQAEAGAKAGPKEAAIKVPTAAKEFTGKRIDLDMTDANVTDVLRLLAEVSNLNIITSDDVKGTISLRLKNVPWDQAFDIILKSKDLDQIREGNVVRVAPTQRIRQEKEASLASRKAQEKLENLEMQFVPISYSNAIDLVKQVQGALTERGSVTSDVRTNTLIIKDLRQGIDAAVALVKKLDTPIPQVLIEARIVEASSSFARDLGIQWGADFQTGGHVGTNTFGSTTNTGQVPPIPGAALGTPVPFTAGTGVKDFAVNLPASGTAGTLGALGFILGKAGKNPLVLDLRLSAGEQEGRLKTISRPRITTMDNKEAKIEQGESIPFETTSASGTSTTFVDANLSLTVTPHITPDGSVLMKIKASRNSIGTFRTSAGQPSINKKESSTEVLVTNGETTVIGGIVISDKSETERGIPLLKDIPLVGWLFKSKSVSDTQTELLIFITPTIMKEKITG